MLDFTTGDDNKSDESGTEPAHRDGAEEITFTLDGREMTAYKPKRWHWAQMAAGMRSDAEAGEQFYAIGKFMEYTLDSADQQHLENRLASRDDRLDLDQLIDIFNALVDGWGDEMRKEFDQMGDRHREARRRERAADRSRSRSGNPAKRANITVVSD